MMPDRNLLLDYLKGLAIFLVVWGHTLQYTADSLDVFANPVFTAIYSFHMPLFMAISGYLFFQSQAKRSFGQLVQAKVKQVLVPLLAWAAILLVVENRGALQHQPQLWREVVTLGKYTDVVVWTLWFLWASFVCAVLTSAVTKKLGDAGWAYVGTLLLVLVLPNAHYFFYIKYMLPYFFAGYLYHKYAGRLRLASQAMVYLSFLAWPLLVFFWQREYYIYFSGPTFTLFDPHSLFIIGYRYLTGFFGTILFSKLVQQLVLAAPARRVAAWLGIYSLGIYVLGFIINPLLVVRLHFGHYGPLLYSLVLTPLVAAVVAAVAGGLTLLMSRMPLLNRYLLGGRKVVVMPKSPLTVAQPVVAAAR